MGSALTLMLDRSRVATLTALTVVGIMTWFAHGTCSQLAQMFPARDTVLLQAGMQSSNLLALALVLAMGLSAKSIHATQIDIYYSVALGITTIGAVTWAAFLTRTDKAFARLTERDSGFETCNNELDSATNPMTKNDPEELEEQELVTTQTTPDTFEAAPEHTEAVWQCVAALFLTVVCSNVMGCLFTYIKGSGDLKITTALVYCRLLSDALSRPITNFWRPQFALSPKGLLGASLIRTGCLSVFFIYQADFFRADWFIMLFVSVYSFFSGILTTFSYVASQEACQHEPSGGIRELALTQASGRMNIAFNAAGFIGVGISIGLSFILG